MEVFEDLEFKRTKLKEDISIHNIITVHYFEYASDFMFSGERHNFWELLYVDKGQAVVIAGESTYRLNQGEMIFHKPNEFHNVSANGKTAPNLIVIAFECISKGIKFFENKILGLDDDDILLLSNIISQAKSCFKSPLDDVHQKKITLKKHCDFGSLQLIKIDMEKLLILLVQKHGGYTEKRSRGVNLSTQNNQKNELLLINKISKYLEENINESISFADVCVSFGCSSTRLKLLFKKHKNMGVIEYFNLCKIEAAKRMIREESCNFSQISQRLSFSSVHYFSRAFKKSTGLSPSEYGKSVKAKSENLII